MKSVPDSVLGVIQRAEVQGSSLRVVERLDRKLYLEVNKVLVALGGTWDTRAKAHVFATDPRAAIDRVLAERAFTDPRREFDFFPTPRALAASLVAAANIRAGDRILEPSAGDGRIANAIREAVPRARIRVCETNPEFQALLVELGYELCAEDFLSLDPDDGHAFDRIVMNPPFSKGRDIEHVTRAWSLLASGGRLVAVMAAGVTFREDRLATEFRRLVEAHGECTSLPDGTFKESGTSVRTVRVILDKPLRRDLAAPLASPPCPRSEQLSLFA